MLICLCVFICNDYDGSCFLQYLGMTYLFVFVVINLCVFVGVFDCMVWSCCLLVSYYNIIEEYSVV